MCMWYKPYMNYLSMTQLLRIKCIFRSSVNQSLPIFFCFWGLSLSYLVSITISFFLLNNWQLHPQFSKSTPKSKFPKKKEQPVNKPFKQKRADHLRDLWWYFWKCSALGLKEKMFKWLVSYLEPQYSKIWEVNILRNLIYIFLTVSDDKSIFCISVYKCYVRGLPNCNTE